MLDIRAISLAEKEIYQKLLHKAYRAVSELGIHFAAADVALVDIERHLNTNIAYGLYVDNQLVSTISVRLPWGNNPGPYGVPHIGWVATDPAYKQQGLAQQLFVWFEDNILKQQLKLPFVTLGTAANHPWLSAFYLKNGFIEIGRADLTPDHTTIYYQKILNSELFQHYQQRKLSA